MTTSLRRALSLALVLPLLTLALAMGTSTAQATPDHILRAVGIGSAVVGLILVWLVRR